MLEEYVSGARIAERLARLAEIGALPDNGGMYRLSYTPEDLAARDLFAGWLREAGLTTRLDEAGNLVGRREGTEPAAPVVMTGSHLDTQPHGGRFDGVVGCLCALEVMEAFRAGGFAHRHPVEVVVWGGEESSGRFDLGLIGSRAMAGALTEEHLQKRCRHTGVTLREALDAAGGNTAQIARAARQPGSIKAVIELHIEQGPYLEQAGLPIGIVTAINGNARVPIHLRGQQAHSGAMPMDFRRDALTAAAEILLAIESAGRARKDPPVVATVGYFSHAPQAMAIVPGRVDMTADVRSYDPQALAEVVAEIQERAREIAARRKIDLTLDPIWGIEPVTLAPEMPAFLAGVCEEMEVPYQRMPSGAMHDCMQFSRLAPVGMIFVPSAGGISHAPEEFTATADIETGARVLCRAIVSLAG